MALPATLIWSVPGHPAVYQFVLEYYFMLGAADELRDRYKAGRGSGRATGATTAVNPRRDLATPEP